MYQLARAVAKPKGSNGRWAEVDIGELPLAQIFDMYEQVFAALQDQFMTAPEKFDLALLRDQYASSQKTFNQFLLDNGNSTLTTSGELPTVRTRLVKFYDAWRSKYTITPVAPNAAPEAEFPDIEKTWLHLSHPEVDFSIFRKFGLVTVNGYFHLVDSTSKEAWVVDGMQTARRCNENMLGIYSFSDVGEIECMQIKKEMLSALNPSDKYRYTTCIDLGRDVSKKTVAISIGGYLHILDKKTLYLLNDHTVCLNFNNIPVIERYMESKDHLDYSALPFERTVEAPEHISVDDFLSDENLAALLEMSQSFIVLIDNPEVYIEQIAADVRPGIGTIITTFNPELPLRIGAGRMAEYWKRYEDGLWAVKVIDANRNIYLFGTTEYKNLDTVNDARTPQRRTTKDSTVWLKIASDI